MTFEELRRRSRDAGPFVGRLINILVFVELCDLSPALQRQRMFQAACNAWRQWDVFGDLARQMGLTWTPEEHAASVIKQLTRPDDPLSRPFILAVQHLDKAKAQARAERN